ncbi:hypothetical protein ACFC00_22050 [Streptomyces adustus]|uniref:hypothetical protein n=1 Tax=Streptomyces adustus TaxID=1609272 RepID=UPI0035E1F9C2
MRNALVRGRPRETDDGRLLVPTSVVEPMGSGRPGDALRVIRGTKRATARYLAPRDLPRPRVQWAAFRALARSA